MFEGNGHLGQGNYGIGRRRCAVILKREFLDARTDTCHCQETLKIQDGHAFQMRKNLISSSVAALLGVHPHKWGTKKKSAATWVAKRLAQSATTKEDEHIGHTQSDFKYNFQINGTQPHYEIMCSSIGHHLPHYLKSSLENQVFPIAGGSLLPPSLMIAQIWYFTAGAAHMIGSDWGELFQKTCM